MCYGSTILTLHEAFWRRSFAPEGSRRCPQRDCSEIERAAGGIGWNTEWGVRINGGVVGLAFRARAHHVDHEDIVSRRELFRGHGFVIPPDGCLKVPSAAVVLLHFRGLLKTCQRGGIARSLFSCFSHGLRRCGRDMGIRLHAGTWAEVIGPMQLSGN